MPHSLVSHRHLISCLLPTKDQPVKPGRQPQSEIICWISNLERKLLQGQIFQIGLVFWQMHQVEIPLVSVSSQFDDIQIPSEIFSAVVKSASTGCLKIEFCKNWAFTDPASDWGRNTSNFFVTNAVVSVKYGAVALISVRIMLRNHLFLSELLF